MAIAAARRVSRMHGIHERICSGKAARRGAVDARTVGRIRVACAAVSGCGNVTGRSSDHDHAVVRLAVVAAGAIARDACSGVVERRQCKTGEPCAMTHQTVLRRRRQQHVCRGPAGGTRSVMTGRTRRRRHIAGNRHTRMIESGPKPVTALRIVARATVLRRWHVSRGLTGCNRTVMALGTTGVLWRKCDVACGPEAAVIDRRQGKTAAGGMTVAAALASHCSMKVYQDLWGRWCALNGERGRTRSVDETPRVRTVVAVGARLARNGRRGVVDEAAHERGCVVTVAAISGRRDGNVAVDHSRGAEPIVTGLAGDGVPCQHAVIEHAAQVEAGGVVADVARLGNVARIRVRIRR